MWRWSLSEARNSPKASTYVMGPAFLPREGIGLGVFQPIVPREHGLASSSQATPISASRPRNEVQSVVDL